MRYGTPYKGSKNAIAPWVVEHLPAAETFVDEYRERMREGETDRLFEEED